MPLVPVNEMPFTDVEIEKLESEGVTMVSSEVIPSDPVAFYLDALPPETGKMTDQERDKFVGEDLTGIQIDPV